MKLLFKKKKVNSPEELTARIMDIAAQIKNN